MDERESRAIVSTFTGHGCFVGMLWGVSVPMLGFAISFGILGFPHAKYPRDQVEGGILLGVVGLITFLLSIAFATHRVELRDGVLSQRGVFSPRRRIVLAEAEQVLMHKVYSQTRRMEVMTVRQSGRRIQFVDSFRDFERLRDSILAQVPRRVIEDRR